MTKLNTLQQQYAKSKEKREDYLQKVKKEEEKLKELTIQIKLAEYDAFSDLLAEKGQTVADYLKEQEKKGAESHVSFNQSDTGYSNDL
ncbi:type III restriction enzyme [Streptococcus agalactiae LMG 14747]|uniref:Type III restriction enzyme n=1 Tax=Streptococcus agalactiae LMG 14747 TaxID=1154860 RepID=V6Z2C8_STRAG|nr:type III restriction enzyme [Streptococcus agalactiae LMG 14747]